MNCFTMKINTYEDFLPYMDDLKKYVRSKVKTDQQQDVIQDTVLYIFLKYETLVITNIKGLLINTSNFFINKHFNTKEKIYDISYLYPMYESVKPKFYIDNYNSQSIDDNLYKNLKSISKTLLEPLELQLEHKSIKDIAKSLNLNENTVKTRIKRAKEYLKKEN